MDRAEAVRIMSEISAQLKGCLIPQTISLDKLSQGCQIRIKCELDDETREVLQALAARHGLNFEERDGSFLIKR